MQNFNLSIRATLLLIISILNLLIAGQVFMDVYKNWLDHKEAQALGHAASLSNQLFDAEKYLSLERGSSMSILYARGEESKTLQADIMIDRKEADRLLNDALRRLTPGTPEVREAIRKVNKSRETLAKLRADIDKAIAKPSANKPSVLSHQLFGVSTGLIIDVHNLIEIFSKPYLGIDPAVARQMRFSHLVWNITEYAGREYAILGEAISENRFLTPMEKEELLLWQGRIRYGWELAYSVVTNSTWVNDVKPAMEEARTHYFMTFDQIKGVFEQSPRQGPIPAYPISAEMWLELASQAIDSLHAMNDSVLKVNRIYIEGVNAEAKRSIILSLIWFASVLLLTFYSWRVIVVRVIRPVNSMVNTLYKATRGEQYDAPAVISNHDEIGKLASVLKVFQDNSRQLAEERDRAEAANIAKSEFLANMSHEIRTPMNVVLGLSNILARTQPLTERQQEFIKTLQLSAESLLSLINDLLDFSKIETRTFDLEKIPFSLENVINEIINIMSVKAREKGLNFRTDLADIKGKTYVGDPTRIRQILMNLCGNAVKFTEQGSITFSVISSPADGNKLEDLCLSVSDTGIGIPPDKLDLIFDKFTQADSTINRKYGGTGLGLAIAKAFVEMMDGEIAVESVYGKGTTFTVCLPLPLIEKAPPAQKQEPIEQFHPEPEADNTTVLLVEDYQPNVLVAGTYLEQFGFRFDVAENGHEALDKFKQKRYHAILMDVQMHGMDGYQTTQAIRRYEQTHTQPAVRIIGMTAHAMPGDREKCLEAGMDDYLSKPFNPEDLRKKLAA